VQLLADEPLCVARVAELAPILDRFGGTAGLMVEGLGRCHAGRELRPAPLARPGAPV
jgi:hypothetical protein